MKEHLQTPPKGQQKATQTLPKGQTPPKGQQKGAKMQAKGKAQAQARAVLMWRNLLIMLKLTLKLTLPVVLATHVPGWC